MPATRLLPEGYLTVAHRFVPVKEDLVVLLARDTEVSHSEYDWDLSKWAPLVQESRPNQRNCRNHHKERGRWNRWNPYNRVHTVPTVTSPATLTTLTAVLTVAILSRRNRCDRHEHVPTVRAGEGTCPMAGEEALRRGGPSRAAV